MRVAATRASVDAPWGLVGRGLGFWRMARSDGMASVHSALVDQAVVSLANFLCNVLLARALGLGAFGTYSLAWMGVLFLNGMQIAAITAPMMSIGPKQSDASLPAYYGALFWQAVTCAVLSGLVLFVAAAGIGALSSERGLHLPFALAAAGVAFQLQDYTRRYFFVTGRASRALGSDVMSYLGQLGLIAVLALMGSLTTERALWCSAATSLAGSSMLLADLPAARLQVRDVTSVWRQHWPTAKWLSGSAILQWFSGNQLFTVAAAAIVGVTAAGAMKAAQNIMGVLHILFQGLENVLPTEAARRLHSGGLHALLAYVRRLSALTGALTLAAVLAAFLLPELWLRLLYGAEVVEYAFVLRWYAVIYLLVFIGTPLRACLRALEATQSIFWSTAVATGFSIATAHLLTARFGVHGAMVGIAISFLVMQTALWVGTVEQVKRWARSAAHGETHGS